LTIAYRKEKLASQIAKEASRILLFELRDPRKGFCTVTRAVVSDDLQYAKVFVSIMGTAKDKKLTMDALDSASGFVQAHLAKALMLRHAPEVSFVRDDSIDKAIKMTQLLDEIAAQRKKKEAKPAKRKPAAKPAKKKPAAKPPPKRDGEGEEE
jgi:ribosome-binding factor A